MNNSYDNVLTMLDDISDIQIVEKHILTTMDIRRSPTSAPFLHRTNPNNPYVKVLMFTLYTGDLWVQNPDAHVYLMSDGYITPGVGHGSLRGRGITIGHVPFGVGVGFELFGVNSGYEEGFLPIDFLPDSFYNFIVQTDLESVAVNVQGPEVDVSSILEFSGEFESCDTVMGIAGDKKSATCGLFNFHQMMVD